MFQILHDTNIPFMKHRKLAYLFSGLIVLVTLFLLFTKGPRYSVDFTGGTLVQIRTAPAAHADDVRGAMDAAGFKGAEIQQMTGESADEFLIRVANDESDAKHISERISEAVTAKIAGTTVEVRRIESVGPQVGS